MKRIVKLAIASALLIYMFIFLNNLLYGNSVLYAISYRVLWAAFYFISTTLLLYYFVVRNNDIDRYLKSLQNSFTALFNDMVKQSANFMFSLTEALVFVLFIQTFYIGHYMIPTPSMVPVIEMGDHYLVNMVKYKFVSPQREEIVIFKSPVRPEMWCKRLVALPGDRIKIKDGKAIVNGITLKRSYSGNLDWYVPKRGDIIKLKDALFKYKENLYDEESIRKLGLLSLAGVEILEYGKFFVNGQETGLILDENIYYDLVMDGVVELTEDLYMFLGDNTDNSIDSRYIGFINYSRIKGELLFRIWPLSRIGIVS